MLHSMLLLDKINYLTNLEGGKEENENGCISKLGQVFKGSHLEKKFLEQVKQKVIACVVMVYEEFIGVEKVNIVY